jgi:hypothetical protein
MMILLAALAGLASCAPAPSDGCAGWRPVLVDNATVDYLAANDAAALKDLIAHQEFGRDRCGW